MDWNNTLFWLIGLSAVIFTARAVGQRPWPWGWIAVLLIVGGTLLAGLWLFPEWVGFVAAAEWMVLVLIPTSGQRLALRLVHRGRVTAARRVARVVTWLHPADGWPATRVFIDALAAWQQGRLDEGQRLLASLQGVRSSLGRTALALQARQSADWQGFLNWIDVHPLREELLQDSSLLEVYLQSLGEVGRRAEMLHAAAERLDEWSHASAQLRVAALCGDVRTVDTLLAGALHGWPADVVEFWRATARQAAGDPTATAEFQRLQQSANGLVAGLAQRRLLQPVPPLTDSELDDDARNALAALRADAMHESQFAVMSSTPHQQPVVTWLIAALLTINFLRELPGGPEDEFNLVLLGAIVIPPTPGFDEWWRPITAAFLHFGWAHFLMNLFALLFLGARLERAWGWWRTLVCYAAAVGVSMTVTPWLLAHLSTEPQMLAGASGGIMGLLGGLLGYLLVGRWRRRTPLVAHQLSMLMGFVLLQTLFDLSHAEVSYQAHLLGLSAGCVCGLLFGGFSRPTPTPPRLATPGAMPLQPNVA